MPNTQRRCAECKFCVWERVDTDLPQWPRCDNSATKLFDHPIGWLHPDSLSCNLFESRLLATGRRGTLTAFQRRSTETAEERRHVTSGRTWNLLGQGGELVAMAVAGAGASNLDKVPGIVAFGVGLSTAVILVIIRAIRG